ncbi:DNA repair helicase XPB [Paenibacillus soyae]|uniref:DNA 3'-5' helicase n=1 Tax=Paenibacillus soyae TaxID=2969249 RepID=A0A9X2MRM1_9BACL|nr:DNA repair helicase XPB [Paenibacillus soyae]MCR2804899.1 helicase-associated domain-containing protein [Paenibacillus soyae]
MQSEGSIIVQSDLTILLDERQPAAGARELLLAVAEAVKRVGSVHTYKITPMSLWNALSAGWEGEEMIERLKSHSRYELPMQAEATVRLWASRYGKLKLSMDGGELLLTGDAQILQQLKLKGSVAEWVRDFRGETEWLLHPECRGVLKQELTRLGYPVFDRAGYHAGQALSVALREKTAGGVPFVLRPYQQQAVSIFSEESETSGGSGVVVLPCGTGKTIVGIAALAKIGAETLILTSSRTSAEQWRDELLDKTNLTPDSVCVYGGKGKQVSPVTIATYQLLTYRKSKSDDFRHMGLFNERDWGLIIYDEVHLLPAPVFRMTASIQATRRLGLTATLVREDGCAEDVYSLIGPKHYDMNWKTAEEQAYISSVSCAEIRVPLADAQVNSYRAAAPRSKLRIAAENANKLPVVRELLRKHGDKPTLVIGQYLKQLKEVAEELGAPLLTGETPQEERLRLYDDFRAGEHPVLVVSKVANLAIDLPDAAVAIQLSGSFGSRQEEAQRVGRLLRPKSGSNEAWFYTLVTEGTKETEFALRRQMFMLEQGYDYMQLPATADWLDPRDGSETKEAAQG